jgi:phage terminase large subunit-like protein
MGDDFCAFTFLFPLRNGHFGVKTRSYITTLTMMKLPGALRAKYEQFVKEGSLHVMEGTVLDIDGEVFDDVDAHILASEYDVRAVGFDPYGAKAFMGRWEAENGPFGIVKVIQGARTESIPLGELKILAGERMLRFDEELMCYAMGNAVVLEDTNGNRKLMKLRQDEKIDNVSALMDAYVAYKDNKEAFE